MTQEIDPTVKIWPGFGEDEEPEKCTILFIMETACTPLPGAPTINKYHRQSSEGYPTKVD